MEALCCLMVATVAGLGSFSLASPATAHVDGPGRRILGLLWDKVVRPLSERALPTHLLRMGAWSSSCDVLVRMGRERGLDTSAEEVSAAAMLVLLALFALGLSFSLSPVGGASLLCLGTVGFCSLGSMDERRLRRELSEEMPGVFRTLAVALGTGQTLSQAIEYVGSHEHGPAAEGFARTSLRMRCGMSAEEALALMANELDAPGIGLLVTALTISQRTGSPLRGLFQRSAQLVERQQEFERTLAVKTAQVRLSARVVCLLPLIMVGLLSLISEDFQRGMATTVGTLSVLVALGLDVVALLIIRRLMRGVL